MQATWLIIVGISIRVGIDAARYAALRSNRRSGQLTETDPGDELKSPAGADSTRVQPERALGVRPSGQPRTPVVHHDLAT
jgi:hypothetical protein